MVLNKLYFKKQKAISKLLIKLVISKTRIIFVKDKLYSEKTF